MKRTIFKLGFSTIFLALMQNSRYNKCVKIGMKSDCVLNDDELEEKRQVIIKNRIKRMKRKRFYCLITKCNCPTVTRSNQMHCRGNHDTVTQSILFTLFTGREIEKREVDFFSSTQFLCQSETDYTVRNGVKIGLAVHFYQFLC